MDDAEDRDAGADAEAGDEDGERREAGVAPQDADGVTQILKELGESHARLDGRWCPSFTGRDVDRSRTGVTSLRQNPPAGACSSAGKKLARFAFTLSYFVSLARLVHS